MSNISCDSIGKVILQDIASRSVARCECKAGAALMASTKIHFERMLHEYLEMDTFDSQSWMISFFSYRQDATNERRKRSTLELHSGYVMSSSSAMPHSWAEDGVSTRRLSDVLPITDETAAGTLGFTMKALRSLGCPTWDELQQWNLILGGI